MRKKNIVNSQSQKLETLVVDAQKGDKEAFKELFEHFNDGVFAYVLSRTSNRDDALDIVQETFIDLWKGLEKFKYKSEESFYGFIFKISKRKLYKYYRSKAKSVSFDEKFMGESYEMETEDYRYLLKHINALETKYQDVLRLRYWSGLKFAEVAATLNVRETTAKVWHHRAIKKLQVYLQNYEQTI